MPVTVNLGTLLAGLGYYAGKTAERYEETTISLGGTNIKTFVLKDSITISQGGDSASLVFNNVPAGKHRFCIRNSSGVLQWRSVIHTVSTGNETFRFTIISVPAEETTFASEKFEDEIEMPRSEDIPDLDEDLNLTGIDVAIKSSHIDIDGEGNIAKGDDWTILQSDLDFDYDFKLKPALSINHKKIIRVAPVGNMTLNLSNPVTGVGVFFMQDTVNRMIRTTIENIVNKQISKQLKKRVKKEFGDSDALKQVTATVLSSDIIEDGTTTVNLPAGPPMTVPVNKLQLIVDISIPSELITNSTGGNSGCFGTILVLAACIGSVVLSTLLLILK